MLREDLVEKRKKNVAENRIDIRGRKNKPDKRRGKLGRRGITDVNGRWKFTRLFFPTVENFCGHGWPSLLKHATFDLRVRPFERPPSPKAIADAGNGRKRRPSSATSTSNLGHEVIKPRPPPTPPSPRMQNGYDLIIRARSTLLSLSLFNFLWTRSPFLFGNVDFSPILTNIVLINFRRIIFQCEDIEMKHSSKNVSKEEI